MFWTSQKTKTKWLLVAGRKDDVFNTWKKSTLSLRINRKVPSLRSLYLVDLET